MFGTGQTPSGKNFLGIRQCVPFTECIANLQHSGTVNFNIRYNIILLLSINWFTPGGSIKTQAFGTRRSAQRLATLFAGGVEEEKLAKELDGHQTQHQHRKNLITHRKSGLRTE